MAVDLSRRARLLCQAERIAHLGSWEYDVRAGVVAWSDELYRIFGFDSDAFTPSYEGYLSRVHPDDRARVRATIEAAMASGRSFFTEHRIVRNDGAERVLRSRGAALTEDGRVTELFGTCYDVTEQLRADEAARRALSLLQATLEATADAIAVIDREGRLAGWNQKFLDLFGITTSEAHVGDVTLFRDRAARLMVDPTGFVVRVEEIEGQPEVETEDELQLLDGRVLDRRSRPQRLDGVVVGRVWSFRDVTERRRLLESQAHARALAEAALQARDEFLSIASHELRTPVTSLQLYVQNLLSGVPTPLAAEPALAKPLHAIERQARRLRVLVGDLIDATRLETGTLDLYPQATDLGERARAVVTRARDEAAAAGSAITLESPGPIVGVWDPARLEQVIEKLVANAIRWGAGRPIVVRLRRDDDVACLEVLDNGPGVPCAERDKIFGRYARTSRTRSFGGLGLGLFIARRIVDGHGGRIFSDVAPGGGARFVVELPLRPPAERETDGA